MAAETQYTLHVDYTVSTRTYLYETLGIDGVQVKVLTIARCRGTRVNTQRQQYCVPTLVEVDQIIVQWLGAAEITRGGGGQETKGNRGQLVL